MKSNSLRFWYIWILTVMAIALFRSQSGAQEFSLSPLNPDFLNAIQHGLPENLQFQTTEDGYALGYIPPPLDLTHLRGQSIVESGKQFYATKYDLRTLGKVSPVKDQGDCGSCWTFATFGSLESRRLAGESWDFSENNLKTRMDSIGGIVTVEIQICRQHILPVGVVRYPSLKTHIISIRQFLQQG